MDEQFYEDLRQLCFEYHFEIIGYNYMNGLAIVTISCKEDEDGNI